jgi:cell division protein FtsN
LPEKLKPVRPKKKIESTAELEELGIGVGERHEPASLSTKKKQSLQQPKAATQISLKDLSQKEPQPFKKKTKKEVNLEELRAVLQKSLKEEPSKGGGEGQNLSKISKVKS